MTKEALNLELNMTKEAMQQALKCAKRCEAIDGMHNWGDTITALKKILAQPQCPWVGLTEDEVALIAADCSLVTPSDFYFAQAIEARFKEKNA